MEKNNPHTEKLGKMNLWEMANFFLRLGQIKSVEKIDCPDNQEADKLPPMIETASEHALRMRDEIS